MCQASLGVRGCVGGISSVGRVPLPIRTVHLVAKTHLDLGFTALADEVESMYLSDYFPRAIATAQALRERGGPEQLVWTTGSRILERALADPDLDRAAAVAAAVREGTLSWHALPLTTHTELMDATLVRSGLSMSRRLDDRFGIGTTAAKMTDVPGHTRGLVPLLAEAGVTFLHLGVNPAWPIPEVPATFRWRAPDGSEIVVAYQAGGYGGEVVVPGCDEALAFLHAGDNLGPPTADEVVAVFAEVRARHPTAEVRASTLDAFARALEHSGARSSLPVVTAEIGDPWLFGAASDPQKVAAYRAVLRERSTSALLAQEVAAAVDERLLLVAEHTWGLDQKVVLRDDRRWAAQDLARLRAEPAGQRFESSWAEQRAYVDDAAQLLVPGPGQISDRGLHISRRVTGWASSEGTEFPVGEVVQLGSWELQLDPATGGAMHLLDTASGRRIAEPMNPVGLVSHQSFDEADYECFYAGLTPTAADEWWARWDNTKPGIDACGARSSRTTPTPRRWFVVGPPASTSPVVLVELRFDADAIDLGAPPVVWQRWSASSLHGGLDLEVAWAAKPATRLPEALWCSFQPIVAEPNLWEMDKLGQRVSPLDVVRGGGRSLHAVGEGMHYDGPDGSVTIATFDAPLVAPGAPNLLDADPPIPDLAGGWHVLLADNCWGTNFPMWIEGPASFSFRLLVS